jgi:hypothetical protein
MQDWLDRVICALFDLLTGDRSETRARSRGPPRPGRTR